MEKIIQDAIVGLKGLETLLVPFFKKVNFEGLGEPDAIEFTKHLNLARQALEEKLAREKGCAWCNSENDLEFQWIDKNGYCPVCGKPIIREE